MLIFSIFDQSIELEQALAELEYNSIPRENILLVFMDNHRNEFQQHSPHAFEIGISVATGGAVIGASLGFVITLGPILCGLIGAFIGFVSGVFAFSLHKKIKKQAMKKKENYEVTVVIQCKEDQVRHVSDILWKYQARSVGFNTP